MAVRKKARRKSPWTSQAIGSASFTVGAEATNVVNVAVQLKDERGNNLSGRHAVDLYFSDNTHGGSLIATAPSGAVAIGTNGVLIDQVTKKAFKAITNATGALDINITEAGAKTMYAVVVLPDGSLAISGAITHAA